MDKPPEKNLQLQYFLYPRFVSISFSSVYSLWCEGFPIDDMDSSDTSQADEWGRSGAVLQRVVACGKVNFLVTQYRLVCHISGGSTVLRLHSFWEGNLGEVSEHPQLKLSFRNLSVEHSKAY